MADAAAFRPADVTAVYGEWPCCLLTNRSDFVDLHHCLGRGGKGDRKVYSSVLNCIPLFRHIHEGPRRDHRLLRRFFLAVAREYVMNAVAAGSYELTEIDRAFLQLSDDWMRENPC